LTAALYARDQVIASYLAQESMEVIKNRRDNNLNAEAGIDWLQGVLSVGSTCSGSLARCDASAVSSSNFKACGPYLAGCEIFLDDNNGYNPDDGQSTIFHRYYFLTKPNDTDPDTNACEMSDAECEAHVVVTWKEGTVPYEVNLNSEIVQNLR
jgi:hypothetical protein